MFNSTFHFKAYQFHKSILLLLYASLVSSSFRSSLSFSITVIQLFFQNTNKTIFVELLLLNEKNKNGGYTYIYKKLCISVLVGRILFCRLITLLIETFFVCLFGVLYMTSTIDFDENHSRSLALLSLGNHFVVCANIYLLLE